MKYFHHRMALVEDVQHNAQRPAVIQQFLLRLHRQTQQQRFGDPVSGPN
jgi:hypothetical protein